MFEKIERNDKVFQSDLFSKDSLAFCIIDYILSDTKKYPDPKLFSDGEKCIVVNSDPKHPIIVWTTDDFREKEKLYDFVKEEFHTNTPFKIMAKKNFYDFLVENHKIPELSIQTLGVYSCSKLNDIHYVGHPDHAKAEELLQIAQMHVNFNIETGENREAKLADYMDDAKEFISDPTSYVWRDENGKIVAIAAVRANDKHPRIGRVYTQKDERGKSYAKMIVHYLSSLVLKSGKESMLFTDFDYAPSNHCYQAVGYKLNCTIVNFIPPLEE